MVGSVGLQGQGRCGRYSHAAEGWNSTGWTGRSHQKPDVTKQINAIAGIESAFDADTMMAKAVSSYSRGLN